MLQTNKTKFLVILVIMTLVWLQIPIDLLAATPAMNNISSGSGSSSPNFGVAINSIVYFAANDGTNGIELWKSDGTADGTVMVKDIRSGGNSSPASMLNFNNVLYFQASDSSNGGELWKSDGTADGTVMVKDIRSGSNSSQPASLTKIGDIFYFTANDGTNGIELWKSDGTADGTVMVKDINGTSASSQVSALTNVDGILYFVANDGTNGIELWKSDGTADGTVMVKDINASGNASPSSLTAIDGMLYFAANDGTHGIEVWKSDGTADGTVMVKDVNSGSSSSNPNKFTSFNNLLYFEVDDSGNGDIQELWKSDGTESGTTMVKSIGGTPPVSSTNQAKIGDIFYFKADDGIHGPELWKSDGTTDGTTLVKDIKSGSGDSSISNLTNVNGVLYFRADDGIHGPELWKSDGTESGTVLVYDVRAGASGSSLVNFFVLDGLLFFSANDGTNGAELWVLDTVFPTITISGSNPASVYKNASYSDAGATASDNLDGSLTSSVVANISVDTANIGSGSVTYSVSDAAGNTAVATRTIDVIAAPATGGGATASMLQIINNNRFTTLPQATVPAASSFFNLPKTISMIGIYRPYTITVINPPVSSSHSLSQANKPDDSQVKKFIFKDKLQNRSIGPAVTELQQLLKELGYFTYPLATGFYGQYTYQAVLKFQKDNNLKASGLVDQATVNLLNDLL